MNILYKSNIIEAPDDAYDKLLNELAWVHADTKLPRKEYYVHNEGLDYTYGNPHYARTYTSQETHPVIESIRSELKDWLGTDFDVVFLNLYENEKNHLGWHADDSPEMSDDHSIVTVSLGAEREIWFRENGSKDVDKKLLAHGSALAMLPGMQDTHEHRIPKCGHPCGPRISLTYRKYVNPKKIYTVVYLDSREGDLRRAVVEAVDESEAYDLASEDYYFGKYIETREGEY